MYTLHFSLSVDTRVLKNFFLQLKKKLNFRSPVKTSGLKSG